MGDYIDKGPQPRATLDFVRALTDAFPTRITALLGNHEAGLLRTLELDRRQADLDRRETDIARQEAAFHQGAKKPRRGRNHHGRGPGSGGDDERITESPA